MTGCPAGLPAEATGAEGTGVDPRRWWLLGGGTPALLACLAAVADPSLRPPADYVLVAFGVLAAAILWSAAGRRTDNRAGWRMLALSPLLPAMGTLLAVSVQPTTALQFVVVLWAVTVPGYVLATLGVLALAERERICAGARALVELGLFVTACLLMVQLLVLGPGGDWAALDAAQRTVLGAAVIAMSALMAASLMLLGSVEPGRQRTALLLFASTVLLSSGRGLATSARLSHALATVDSSRFLVLAGIGLLVLAGLIETGPADGGAGPGSAGARTTLLGQLLPHLALLVAGGVAVVAFLRGHQPTLPTVAGMALCIALVTVHRWLSVREERRMAARLERSEAYFRSLVRTSGDGVLILDEDLRISWSSASLDRVLGDGGAAALIGRPVPEVVHPEDVDALTAALPGGTLPAGRDAALPVLRLRNADGTWRFLEVGVCDLREDSDVGAVVLQCRDMTERHAREAALRSIAYTDPGTGLPNAAGWLQTLRRAVAEAATPDGGPDDDPRGNAPTGAAVLLVELDGLGSAREHAGREVVTAVVAEVGRRLRATVRGEDVVARLGGGGFAVLAAGTVTEADRLADRCLGVVEQPIVTPAGLLDLTASIGIAPVEEGLSVEEVRTHAELAVRAARAAGPGRCVRYSPRLGEAAVRRDRLRAELEGAAARGELHLAVQPVVLLSEQRVGAFECLLRWRHPELGEVPPAEFLPIAERAGLIGGLQRWVLGEATRLAVALPATEQPLHVAVNVSAVYLAGGTVVTDVENALRSSGLAPERLVLEVTEAATCGGPESVLLDVETLRLMGVHVALDDFGTGESALGSLTRLPLDVLKLDGSLTTRIDRDPKALALCRSIIGIAHALGLAVVAEGVETPAQLGSLCGLGCDYVQGFLLARPMALADLAALLREGTGQLWPGLVGSGPVARR